MHQAGACTLSFALTGAGLRSWPGPSVQYNLLIFIAANHNSLHLHIESQRPDNNREKGWQIPMNNHLGKVGRQNVLLTGRTLNPCLACCFIVNRRAFICIWLWSLFANWKLRDGNTAPLAGQGKAIRWLATLSCRGLLKGGSSTSTTGGTEKMQTHISHTLQSIYNSSSMERLKIER